MFINYKKEKERGGNMSSKEKSLMEAVNDRTNLAQTNQLEIMHFNVGSSKTIYGINVFKVLEIVRSADYDIRTIINVHNFVSGIINHRSGVVTIVSLAKWLGEEVCNEKQIVICSYNKVNIGFLIAGNSKITRKNWNEVMQPSGFMNSNNTVSGVVKLNSNDNSSENPFIQILDVENLLSIISPSSNFLSEEEDFLKEKLTEGGDIFFCKDVLVAEDSHVARLNVKRAFDLIGVSNYKIFNNGQEILDYIANCNISEIGLVITDLEMPQVSGFIVIKTLKEKPETRHLPILVNSSMSDDSNIHKIKDLGASDFIPKTSTEELIQLIKKYAITY